VFDGDCTVLEPSVGGLNLRFALNDRAHVIADRPHVDIKIESVTLDFPCDILYKEQSPTTGSKMRRGRSGRGFRRVGSDSIEPVCASAAAVWGLLLAVG
jgi:hypothetical protein